MPGQVVLGVDPAFRTCGYCLVRVGPGGKILAHGTIDAGSSGVEVVPKILAELGKRVVRPRRKIDVVSIEQINWYGKRKGVLALAHLAGAVAGYFSALGATIRWFPAREVKARSAKNGAPRGFDDHQMDALSLVKLART